MGIKNLQKTTLNDFRAGRRTAQNLTKMLPESALTANDVMFLGDGLIRKRKGYTTVISGLGSIIRIFEFQRQSDLTDWVIIQHGSTNGAVSLRICHTDGTNVHVLSTTENTAPFSFATSPFGLYMSNGVAAYVWYNVGGTETLYKWGLPAPVTAPTVALSAGTLTLVNGREYMFSWVRKWTDNVSTTRVHVGPPSPISANTGPFTNEVVNVAGIPGTPPAGCGITHVWIWSTTDLAEGTSGDFIFCAEITIGTTSFGDSQTVAQLDASRVATVDNLQPPFGSKLVEYQGRIAIMVQPGANSNQIQFTGLEEIALGIPQETAPSETIFTVPGKSKAITSGVQANQQLFPCTGQMFFQITGYDVNTFQKQDDIIEPGAAGPECIDIVNNQMAYLGTDKKIWAWDFASAPVDVSQKLSQPLLGQRSMNDLNDAQLANAMVRVLNFGRFHILFVFANTDGNPGYNWVQAWDASNIYAATGYRTFLSDGSNIGLCESDFNFTHRMTCAAIVYGGNTKYLWMGDANGNVYRFPDAGTTGTAGTDAGAVATITATAVASNVLTVSCVNTFSNGQKVSLNGLTTHTELNAQVLTITSCSGTQFTASWTHKNYTTTSDTGVATTNPITPQWGSVWMNHGQAGVIKRNMFTDIITDRSDAVNTFNMLFVASDATDMTLSATTLPQQVKPASYGTNPSMIRGSMMQQAGTAIGEWARLIVNLPNDANDASIEQIEINVIPLAVTAP